MTAVGKNLFSWTWQDGGFLILLPPNLLLQSLELETTNGVDKLLIKFNYDGKNCLYYCHFIHHTTTDVLAPSPPKRCKGVEKLGNPASSRKNGDPIISPYLGGKGGEISTLPRHIPCFPRLPIHYPYTSVLGEGRLVVWFGMISSPLTRMTVMDATVQCNTGSDKVGL